MSEFKPPSLHDFVQPDFKMKSNSNSWLKVLSTFIKVTHKLKKCSTSKQQVSLNCRDVLGRRAVHPPNHVVYSRSSKKYPCRVTGSHFFQPL